ncbi:ribulose-phosphate 3-epimerase [Brumicola pallidula]|jgi:ribulose-phosphate 3-epimerase|uniref:Ribulose-phosphate 3-epimerase n=1 Tax=Brumicola pallidula DSM 14239 = ACAM 615 TaxID=1121922 RepID=K6YXM7_9ALTE|nr:ribulose-phosphate 3-epimerase [Glaciecola pallidula]GAC28726.1 ribulose-phosphate 3-epimerase [Glaciecola pallidula DSM 14239 = ACAM 615]
MHTPLIAPSILSADFACLGQDVQNVLDSGADIVHFDVMDNHYVPNLSFGPMICDALRKYGIRADIDVHLMVQPVDSMIQAFAKAGASMISFHPEATMHLDRSIQLIKDNGCKAGLALNPGTPLHVLDCVLEKLDYVLLMSVNPGFGGQSFIENTLTKITELKRIIDAKGLNTRIEVDGGIKIDNIKSVWEAGADMFVAGSAIFSSDNYADTIAAMKNQFK